MDVAVNVNINPLSVLLCGLFANNLINCQQNQNQDQTQCEVIKKNFSLFLISISRFCNPQAGRQVRIVQESEPQHNLDL